MTTANDRDPARRKRSESEYVPRTELGRRLLEIRKRILASGQTRSREEILEYIRALRSGRWPKNFLQGGGE